MRKRRGEIPPPPSPGRAAEMGRRSRMVRLLQSAGGSEFYGDRVHRVYFDAPRHSVTGFYDVLADKYVSDNSDDLSAYVSQRLRDRHVEVAEARESAGINLIEPGQECLLLTDRSIAPIHRVVDFSGIAMSTVLVRFKSPIAGAWVVSNLSSDDGAFVGRSRNFEIQESTIWVYGKHLMPIDNDPRPRPSPKIRDPRRKTRSPKGGIPA